MAEVLFILYVAVTENCEQKILE